MSIKVGWLKDNDGNNFAPKTISSQVVREDGTLLEDKVDNLLNNAGISIKTFNANSPLTIPVGSYGVILILGMIQNIGGVILGCKVTGSNLSVYDMTTGESFSSSHVTFAISGKNVTISSTSESASTVTVIVHGRA